MINRLIYLAIHHRVSVLLTAFVLLVWGAYSYKQLPVEAYPDVMNTQVVVMTQWPGHAAEEIEKQVTIPLEISLYAVPHVQAMRSRSLFGLSAIYLTFEDGVDDYFAREQINENMSQATLPNGIHAAHGKRSR